MDLLKLETEPLVASRKPLPQIVPGSACLRCDVCCHFPEADSFLRPYFTADEMAGAVAAGVDPTSFPDADGSQIALVENPNGDGYLCPAFDTTASRCKIYDHRPLDCQLYPLALMWDAAHETVLLGWDAKCPYMVGTPPPAIAEHAERVSDLLMSDGVLDQLSAHPCLIGPYQDDVVVLRELPALTTRLRPRPVHSIDARLRPLTSADGPRFHRAVERARLLEPDALAAYAFPYHAIWTSLMPYWWLERADTFFLFAESPDGLFMPLVPLGARPLEEAVTEAVALMQQWNGISPVNRIENVMDRQRAALQAAGFRVTEKGGDYLYRADALASLAGDDYKSHRALCNRIEREHAATIEPYQRADAAACLALYERWAGQKQAGAQDSLGNLYLEDAKAAHERALTDHHHLGLEGTVARIDGSLRAYTFGYWLTPETFCVLLEVADRSVPGLAQVLFRATCRAALAQGASFINAMDDAGLAGLRDAKRAYRPVKIIGNGIVTSR